MLCLLSAGHFRLKYPSISKAGVLYCRFFSSEFSMGSTGPISRIAIIGAGPVGVACFKFLLAEKTFDQIDVIEQRKVVGGIWNWSRPAERTVHLPVPQEDPTYGVMGLAGGGKAKDDKAISCSATNATEFESPIYDDLEANIPKKSMQYSDTPFPDEYPLYPTHQQMLRYLESYAEEVKHMIKFETQVQDIHLLDEGPGRLQAKWQITSRNLQTDSIAQSTYDAVVIATGHYDVPHLVSIPGVAEWNAAYPGAVLHSKAYRSPQSFTNQRVLVIGNSASGSDIAFHVGTVASKLYLSSRSESVFWTGAKVDWKEDVDEVVEFLPSKDYNRAVRTKSGKVIEDLDSVVFATGYFYSVPFLSIEPPVTTDGLRVRDTYMDLIHIEHPTLMLPAISNKVLPLQLGEHQASVIARLWSGRLQLPSKKDMRQWEKDQMTAKGTGKRFHLKAFPEELALMNDAYMWAASAISKAGLENGGVGKLGIPWELPAVWLRSKFIDIKMAYIAKGEARKEIYTVEQLGFDFKEWKKTAKPEELEMFKKARYPSLYADDGKQLVNGVH